MASFSIRSRTIRLGIFISTLVIAAIIIFQLVWLKNVYRFEEKEFDHSVIKAVRGVYEDMDASNYNYSHLNELIENPEPHLYLARVVLPVNTDSLVSFMQDELEYFDVFTDCHLGIYRADSGRYVFRSILKSPGLKKTPSNSLPSVHARHDCLVLFFPNRKQYILSRMNFWIIGSALLLLVLILFGGSLYYFYRQKFLNETQKDFIHNFTHEFKTPVSVISLAADVLKKPSIAEKPEKLATYAGIVEYQAAYLKNQTEKLLHLAYTESPHLQLSKDRVNIHQLVEEAMINLAPLINEHKAVIHLDLDAKDPCLQGNRDYLVIVIINLVDNAIKYSRDPRVTITTRNTPGDIELSVKDNGIGIAHDQFKNLFKKFFRIRKEDTYVSKGFGIGLSFVHNIVAAHGGKIKVESEPGKGSTFTIKLPVH